MKAVFLKARGGPEALVLADAPTPAPGSGEVLVRVHASAVTPTELEWLPTWTTRDGGARLEVEGRLYETYRDYDTSGLDGQWGRFWK